MPREPIPTRRRLILALDVPGAGEARALVGELGDAVGFYKVGLELLLAGGALDLVAWLREQGKEVFLDAKLYDVPRTVAAAVARLAGRGVRFVTVHGDDAILRAACSVEGGPGVLAVTVLTSLDRRDLESLGFTGDVESLVLARARRAVELGCAGVVASGREAAALRAALGPRPALVVPGIRPAAAAGADDQKRTVDVEEAFALGADYIVVGRPVTAAADPRAAAEAIQARIAAHFARSA